MDHSICDVDSAKILSNSFDYKVYGRRFPCKTGFDQLDPFFKIEGEKMYEKRDVKRCMKRERMYDWKNICPPQFLYTYLDTATVLRFVLQKEELNIDYSLDTVGSTMLLMSAWSRWNQ